MDPIEYLNVLRRRWRIVAACAGLALLAGWVSAPVIPGQSPSIHSYRSTVTLVPTPDAPASQNLHLVAYLVTAADVPRRAAGELRTREDPGDLVSSVTAEADTDAGTVAITTTQSGRQQASTHANAFAHATLAFLRDTAQQSRDSAALIAKKQLDDTGSRITGIEAQINKSSGEARQMLEAQRTAELAAYSAAYSRVRDLDVPVEDPGMQVLGSPVTTRYTSGGIAAPSTPGGRLLIIGSLGLALGIIAALVLDRLDVRMRRRNEVAEAFGLPVVTEVPRVSHRTRRDHAVLVVTESGGAVAEAYRSLRSTLHLMAYPDGRGDTADGAAAGGRPALQKTPQVILVASARPGDGKTTTVANLAAALAETGKSVLVLDCDFRSPRVHRYLDAAPGTGLSELLEADHGGLDLAIRPTAIQGVSLVTSGAVLENPAALLLRIGDLIGDARRLADVVLVDSTAMLAANDANDLVQHVDAVVVTCRSGRNTAEHAGRVGQLLRRTSVPVAGVVFIGTPGGTSLARHLRMPGTPTLPVPGGRSKARPPDGHDPADRNADGKQGTGGTGTVGPVGSAKRQPSMAERPAPGDKQGGVS